MKYLNLISLLFTVIFAYAQTNKEDGGSPVKILPHPRLVWLKGEEASIQKAIDTDKNWVIIHQKVIAESDSILSKPTLERIQIGRRLLDKSRECLRRVSYLAYAFRMTNNKKYLDRAEAELVKVSQFSDWNPSHFLDVAEMTLAVAIGYDWLFNDLKSGSKSIIKEAILNKGILPSYDSKYNYWLRASNNWNQVCNAGMVYGALAIQEDNPKLAHEIIERAQTSIKLPLEDYKPDGAYPEGYNYWEYGTSFQVFYFSALKKIGINIEMNAGFEATGSFFQHLVGSSGKSFNYSDAGTAVPTVSSTMFWFANHAKNNSLLFKEKSKVEAKSFGNNRILPFAIVWGMGLNLDQVSEPESKYWTGQGKSPVALIRTSWTDKNSIFLGFKTGSADVSHAHMDVGSFVVDALGQRWSMDLGMQEYESLESKGVKLWDKSQTGQRWEILRYNNFHHSTLTVNDKLQNVSGKAKIDVAIDNNKIKGAISDLSDIYKGQLKNVTRGVGIFDNNKIVIRDEFTTSATTTKVKWNMVSPAKVLSTSGNEMILEQNGKKMYLKVIEPRDAILKSWSTDPKQSYDALNPNTIMLGFENSFEKNKSYNLVVVMSSENDFKNLKIPVLNDWK